MGLSRGKTSGFKQSNLKLSNLFGDEEEDQGSEMLQQLSNMRQESNAKTKAEFGFKRMGTNRQEVRYGQNKPELIKSNFEAVSPILKK